jgi:MSHA biogenesis protein MshJ
MPIALQNLMEQIDSRILRERILIFFTVLAVIFLFWQLLLQSHIDQTTKALEAEQAQLTTEQQMLDSKIATLTLQMASDPAIAKRKNISDLQTKVTQVETQLAGLSQGLISAELLPNVLQDVLARTTSVQLLQVRTFPASELPLESTLPNPNASANSASDTSVSGTGVYKHSVLIRVSGTYAELVKLLQDIESLQWKFYWDSLNYTVKQYPNAEIDIQVFTLSSEEGLLGV